MIPSRQSRPNSIVPRPDSPSAEGLVGLARLRLLLHVAPLEDGEVDLVGEAVDVVEVAEGDEACLIFGPYVCWGEGPEDWYAPCY